jgi:beta-glucanase (GH16 family)
MNFLPLLLIVVLTSCKSGQLITPYKGGSGAFTKLVWNDEFNGKGLPDPAKWGFEEGYIRNHELQYYTAGRIENASQENGNLIITAASDSALINGRKRPITSASLHSKGKGEWKYGRIEVRAKVPPCLGSWPAIWMLPATNKFGGWPRSGEIDIMEFVGYTPEKVYFNAHTQKYNHMRKTGRGTDINCPDASKNFNIYAIEWSANQIDWFLNEKKVFTVTNDEHTWEAWPFDEPFYLILNFAFGGDWGGAQGVNVSGLPDKFYIDYVRVFQ